MGNKEYYNVMELFAGIGGSSYAGKLIGNWKTICYVEWDKYCQQVIQARIRDGIFDDAPIWDDVQTFDGKPWRGSVDIITGGFPCQPFSVAGKRKGESDERNMWPDTLRVIGEVRPRYAFLENVPALITSGYFGTILSDISKIGYNCRWTIVSAGDEGSPQERKCLWIYLGDSKGESRNNIQFRKTHINNADTNAVSWWNKDPADNDRSSVAYVDRMVDGLPNRRNRNHSLGNAWVPQVAATAWDILIKSTTA